MESNSDVFKSPINRLVYLSQREQQVLYYLAHGHEYNEISEMLGVSVNTVRMYVKQLYKKLDVHSSLQAVRIYWENRLLQQMLLSHKGVIAKNVHLGS